MPSLLALALVCASVMAQWPQWRGPGRDGVVAEAHVPAAWPETLAKTWTAAVGEGYSTPVVADGRIFVHGRQDPDEVVTALDLASGKLLWTARYPSTFSKNKYATEMSKGPFSTPLASGALVYTLGTSAVLSAFDAKTGGLKWRRDWSAEIDTSKMFTGTAMSPLLDHGLLIVHVGDDGAGAFHAVDPATGVDRWTLPGHGPGYASPVVATFGGVRQLITMTDKAVVGVGVADGRALWTIPFPDEWNENIVTPAISPDGLVVISGTRKGTFGYRIEKKGDALAPVQAWHNTDVPMYMSSPVVAGRYLYGFSNRRKGQLFCLDVSTGAVTWTTEGRGGANAALQLAGSDLLVLTTDGELLVVKHNPERYEERRRYKVADSPTWAQPVLLSNGILIRDAGTLAFWKM